MFNQCQLFGVHTKLKIESREECTERTVEESKSVTLLVLTYFHEMRTIRHLQLILLKLT